jgi:hypothetical protein
MLQTSNPLKGIPVSEQGAGAFDIWALKEEIKKNYVSKNETNIPALIHPSLIDLTSPRFEPYSNLKFFSGMVPVAFNLTLINPSP